LNKAVCIFNGGMDSTTSSYIAKYEDGYEIIALHFELWSKNSKKRARGF